jgi:hypothetical protein
MTAAKPNQGAVAWLWRILKRLKEIVLVARFGLPERPEYVDSDGALEDVLRGRQRPPGFPCPQCKERIHVAVNDLLTQSSVRCGKCGLELNMQWEPDDRARAALKQLEMAAAETERARQFRR